MKISRLIQSIPARLHHGSGEIEVSDVIDDSRLCSPGCLFIARKGTVEDGATFIQDAIAAGAVAILCTDEKTLPPNLPSKITILISDDIPLTTALLAEAFHGHPSKALTLIGVTGTNGKTTTAHLIQQIFRKSGIPTGLIGTIHIDDGATATPSVLTTPSACEISRTLRRMVDHGCRACVMEVSSHALHQQRVAGLQFNFGVFTNLSGDHLDYHNSMEEYAAAKTILFQSLPPDGCAILNADDPASQTMQQYCSAPLITCSENPEGAHCSVAIQQETVNGMRANLQGPWGKINTHLSLIGRYNALNALQAVACAHRFGLPTDTIANSLNTCSAPPGRLERITPTQHPFTTLVDYAHTDDALHHSLSALRPLIQETGKLRVVFGCGGDRDRTKRPRMAQAACRFADDIIITSDNPRTEPPETIIEEIMGGVPESHQHKITTIVDRAQAIREIISRARPHDIILIAGKGHEDYQIIGHTKRPFDDRRIAAAALQYPAQSHNSHAFFKPENIRALTCGQWLQSPPNHLTLDGVAIDSRTNLHGKAFFAITGENHDGHDFLPQAANDKSGGGAGILVVEQEISLNHLPETIGILKVPNTRQALADLARAHRKNLTETTVIAITGSAGKTTTKAILHAILSQSLPGVAAPKSFNNDIGVPLTILAARPSDRYLIVEIGTSAPGEIATLARITEPDIAVITSLGHAHLEGLGNLQDIAKEKVSLLHHLRPDGLALINHAPATAHLLQPHLPPDIPILKFGESDDCDIHLSGREPMNDLGRGGKQSIEVDNQHRYQLNLPGAHNATNALAAIAIARHLGLENDAISTGLQHIEQPSMRMEHQHHRGVDFFVDCYNANPDSTRAALDTFLEITSKTRRRILILGDMLELGESSDSLHRDLGMHVHNLHLHHPVHHILFVGLHIRAAFDVLRKTLSPDQIDHFPCADDACRHRFQEILTPGDAVLLKASRSIALERLLEKIPDHLLVEPKPTPIPAPAL